MELLKIYPVSAWIGELGVFAKRYSTPGSKAPYQLLGAYYSKYTQNNSRSFFCGTV